MQDFAAIDFETANYQRSSVCSVGVIIVRGGRLTEADTCNAPVFPVVWREIEKRIGGLPLVAHNKAFDESCLRAVFRMYQMDYPDYTFLCTLQQSRKVWPQGQHTLDVIAARCGYNLAHHHHALADAEACAAIALQIL